MAKKKTSTGKSTNKSAFIRGLPADMPAADVVAKAKADGFSLTPAFVYAVRSKAKGKPAGRGRPGRRAKGGKPSASDFVRSQPSSMGAADVVAAGAKQGLKFSTNLVYAVRSAGKKGGGGRRGRGFKAAVAGVEATFRKMALDLGLGRARQALEDLEHGLAQLIGR